MTASDWFNLIAKKLIDAPPEWRWRSIEWLEGANGGINKMVGGVYPATYKSGPRKGRTNFRKPQREDTLYFGDGVLQSVKDDWERSTGNCSTCFGIGRELVGVSVVDGDRHSPCRRCGSTGRAP